MSKPTDGWVLYKDGACIGRGTGYARAGDGETLVYSSDPMSDPDAVDLGLQDGALESIYKANGDDRDAILEQKAITAQLFIDEVIEPLPYYDKDVIDPERYTTLYDEYWATYELVSWTPMQLAQVIVEKFQHKQLEGLFKTESQKEAERRRAKLIAEKTLDSLFLKSQS